MTQGLEVRSLRCVQGGNRVLDALSFSVRAGCFASVLGASGAGKSTLLRCVAGLLPCEGEITVNGQSVQSAGRCVAPAQRGIGFLFQSLGLWPQLTVRQHLTWVLKPQRLSATECAARESELLERLELTALAARLPGELSGGERQRLALARALAPRPRLLLLDEPTSSVDQSLKRTVRALLAETRRLEACTVVHVTHDAEEAFELADEVLILDHGALQQQGSPAEVWLRPASRLVAGLLGEGVAVPATVLSETQADCAFGRITVLPGARRGPVWLWIRPENLQRTAPGEGIPVQVRRMLCRGARSLACVEIAGLEHRLDAGSAAVGDSMHVGISAPPAVLEERSL